MNWLEISRIITVIASVSITIGIYAQAIKIFKTKSASDFTPILLFATIFNELAWLNYGLSLHEWPIILVTSCNVPGVIGMIWGYVKYKNK